MSTARLRIVSDLHVGEPHSRMRCVAQLEPLLEGADHVVFNGDSLDTRFVELDPEAHAHKAAFDAFLAAHAGRITVVTGNHDPDVTNVHHLELEGGAVLVTHGDALFPEVAPWCCEGPSFQAEQERRMAAVPEHERGTLETRLRICKEAVHGIRHLSPYRPGGRGHLWRRRWRLLRAMLRVHRIWRCWREMPDAAVRLAEEHRPAARIVMLGHFHWPGLWRLRGRVVVNTGAATLAQGALAADFVGGELRLRDLRFHRGGPVLGAVRHTVDLRELSDRPTAGPT